MSDLLLRRRQMLVGGSPTPPTPYDARIEYLESSGTQYLNTGVYVGGDTELHMRYGTFTNKLFCLGSRGGVYSDAFHFANGGYTATSYGEYFIDYGSSGFYIGTCHNDDLIHNLVMSNVIEDDGQIIKTFPSQTFTTPTPLYLYAFYQNGTFYNKATMRIYEVQIYNGGVLAWDAYPVRVGTTGYLYDTISQQLYGNVGTGNFILGADI